MGQPYLPRPAPEPGGCGETWLVLRLTLSIALPIVGLLVAAVLGIIALLYLAAGPDIPSRLLALAYLVVLAVLGVVVLARRRRNG